VGARAAQYVACVVVDLVYPIFNMEEETDIAKPQPPESNVKNVAAIFDVLRRRKWNLLLPALIAFGLAAAFSFLSRSYRSTATIRVEGQEVPREYASMDVAGFAERRLRETNRRVLGGTKLLGIMNRFRLYEGLKDRETVDGIVGRMLADIKISVIGTDLIDPRPGIPAQAAITFGIGYEGKHPETVRKVVAALTSLYLEENARIRERRTFENLALLEDEMKGVQAKIAEVDGRIAAYTRTHLRSMPEFTLLNRKAVEQEERDLVRMRGRLQSLREREGTLQQQLAGIPVDNTLHVELSSELAGVRSRIDSVKRQVDDLRAKRNAFRRRIEAAPRVEEGYRALAVERVNLLAKHEVLTGRMVEVKAARGLEEGRPLERFIVLEAASLPARPSSPNIPAVLLIGLALGLCGGAGYAAYKEATDTTAHTLEQLAAALPYPVLVAIPEFGASRAKPSRGLPQ
jgi:succinoglycan biosynthesis transport protein ExoP